MKVRIFYKGEGPENDKAFEVASRLEKRDCMVEKIDTESKEGAQIAEVYEVFRTPTFVVTKDDGSFIQEWRGVVPPEAELKRYLFS